MKPIFNAVDDLFLIYICNNLKCFNNNNLYVYVLNAFVVQINFIISYLIQFGNKFKPEFYSNIQICIYSMTICRNFVF